MSALYVEKVDIGEKGMYTVCDTAHILLLHCSWMLSSVYSIASVVLYPSLTSQLLVLFSIHL